MEADPQPSAEPSAQPRHDVAPPPAPGEDAVAVAVVEVLPEPGFHEEDVWAREMWHWLRQKKKPGDTTQKVSALTVAVLVHAVVLAILGITVIALPRPNPPQLVASLNQTDAEQAMEEVKVTRVTRAVQSSAAAQPTVAVAAMGISDLAIPEFGHNPNLDVTVGVVGAGLATGMSFAAEEAESQVNFFGIKSKGKRIAFVIDAEKYMLTDNKGGIPAYTRVKDEIGKMMAGLNRDTAFNLLIYEGRRLATFRDELVPATPSNVRLAIEWLHPLNVEYESLGILSDLYNSVQVQEGIDPILHSDISGYPKAIQASLEMDVHTLFIIASGWRHMGRTPTDRERADMEKRRAREWNDKKQAAMVDAQKKAQEWLRRENEARIAKGVSPKVVTSLWPIMRQLVPGVEAPPSFRGYQTDEVEAHVSNGVKAYYRAAQKPSPEINLVWFIGEDETPSVAVEEHFKNLTRRNNRGKLKILEGLAAVQNVTGGR